jgi:DNA-binding GntR family transcriptional regulator
MPANFDRQMPAESLTNASVAHAQIRADIVGLDLRPGKKLRLDALKKSYNVGLSPLREALSRLVSEGLVELADQRGFTVSRLSTGDLRDVTFLRQELECLALRLAIERGDDAWEGDILSAHHQLSKPPRRQDLSSTFNKEWEARHRAFHYALVKACGSPRLLSIRNLLYDQSDRYRRIAASNQLAERDIATEHSEICGATLARDTDAACALLKTHIGRTAEIAIETASVPGNAE